MNTNELTKETEEPAEFLAGIIANVSISPEPGAAPVLRIDEEACKAAIDERDAREFVNGFLNALGQVLDLLDDNTRHYTCSGQPHIDVGRMRLEIEQLVDEAT